jgi:hypothetical protein
MISEIEGEPGVIVSRADFDDYSRARKEREGRSRLMWALIIVIIIVIILFVHEVLKRPIMVVGVINVITLEGKRRMKVVDFVSRFGKVRNSIENVQRHSDNIEQGLLSKGYTEEDIQNIRNTLIRTNKDLQDFIVANELDQNPVDDEAEAAESGIGGNRGIDRDDEEEQETINALLTQIITNISKVNRIVTEKKIIKGELNLVSMEILFRKLQDLIPILSRSAAATIKPKGFNPLNIQGINEAIEDMYGFEVKKTNTAKVDNDIFGDRINPATDEFAVLDNKLYFIKMGKEGYADIAEKNKNIRAIQMQTNSQDGRMNYFENFRPNYPYFVRHSYETTDIVPPVSRYMDLSQTGHNEGNRRRSLID